MMSFEQPSQSLKRDHDSFTELDDLADLEAPFSVPTGYSQLLADQETQQKSIETTSEPRPSNNSSSKTKRHPSPTRSSSELTDAGPTTPPRDQSEALPSSAAISTSSAFVMLNASGGNSVATPATKKQKLTFQEKELRKINRDIKEKERAEEKARREVETQARAEEKARKEADRKKKEEEREAKRVALEAEKAAKEERRRKKEEEKHKAEEEKRKKERSQLKLGSFFIQKPARAGTPDSLGRTSMSPAPGQSDLEGSSATTLSASTPIKNEGLYYEKLFPSFFVKDGVTLAPTNRWERDEQATESSLKMIDAHLGGKKHMNLEREFNAAALFHLPSDDHTPRGIRYLPVREIMARFRAGNPSRPIDLTTESQNTQIKRTGDLLRKIPLKFLKFQEDVRPPYKGTYTNRPISGMSKLARNPMMRDLPDKNYDYDSEAEWIEDEDEDGEDLKSDGDEDEELNDDADDMDGFLDDEADDLANSRRRFVVQEDLEPISSGLCWEDRSKRTTNAKMMKYRMEMIKDPTIKSIDPFSTGYWEPTPKSMAMEPPRLPLGIMKTNSVHVNQLLPPSSKPVNPFFPNSDTAKSTPALVSKDGKPKRFIPTDVLPAFKTAIAGSPLSKIGLIEVLKKDFPGHPAAVIKDTLEAVARRGNPGEKNLDRRWILNEP